MVKDAPFIPRPAGAGSRTDRKATMQTWRGAKMVRIHSFLAAIEQIVVRSYKLDVVKINIIGDMGAGKTTLAKAIAHAYHARMKQKYKIPFQIKVLTAKHLGDFKETVKGLVPANYVLIFDDVSFMEGDMSRSQLAKVKNAVTTIRHMGPKDTKICLIYNFHYNLALDKFLRQADYRFWITVGESEYENMERLLRQPKAMGLVSSFIKWRNSAVDFGKWTVPAGKDGKHTYNYRDPWIPALFWDGSLLRHIITPERKWMQKHCSICQAGADAAAEAAAAAGKEGQEGGAIAPNMDAAAAARKFVDEGRKSLGKMNFDTAIKIVLMEHGLGTYSKGVLAAKRALDGALQVKAIELDAVRAACGFTVSREQVRGGYSKFLDAIGVVSKAKQMERYKDDNDDSAAAAAAKKGGGRAKPKKTATPAPPPIVPPAAPAPTPAPAPAPALGGDLDTILAPAATPAPPPIAATTPAAAVAPARQVQDLKPKALPPTSNSPQSLKPAPAPAPVMASAAPPLGAPAPLAAGSAPTPGGVPSAAPKALNAPAPAALQPPAPSDGPGATATSTALSARPQEGAGATPTTAAITRPPPRMI